MSHLKKTYWHFILEEISHKDDPDYELRFTPRITPSTQHINQNATGRTAVSEVKTREFVRYYLDETHPNLYLTQRELDCMRGIKQQLTYVQIGELLKLSPRTVEFYIKGLKAKLNCKTKNEILMRIENSALQNLLNTQLQ